MQSKIRSYVGYAIKSKACCFGVENIVKNKRVCVCIYDPSLSENSLKKLMQYAQNSDKKTYRINVEEIYPNKNCKAIGIMDKNLAQAIMKEMEENGNNG